MNTSLPTDSVERKKIPLLGGLFGYFAAALVGVAKHSAASNEKHNPGQPLHWSFDKSNDHAECVQRHLLDLQEMVAAFDRAKNSGSLQNVPTINMLLDEANALAWRTLALSQTLHMRFTDALLPFNARRSAADDAFIRAVKKYCSPGPERSAPFEEGWPAPRCPLCKQQPCLCHEES